MSIDWINREGRGRCTLDQRLGLSPNSSMDAKALIELLGLEPLGFEGGWFKETIRCDPSGPTWTDLDRSLHTAILYLLTPDTRGLMHRLRFGEVYHFYHGDPVDLVLLHEGGHVEHVVLGPDVFGGQKVQHHVPAGVWQGARVQPGGRYGLMGTTMVPGFDLRDFELGDREQLRSAWPEAQAWIDELTPHIRRTTRFELVAATRDLLHAELRSVEALAAGTRSRAAADWRGLGRDQAVLRAENERLEAGPEQRRWWTWYVVRRSDRRLLGTAGFEGPPRAGRVRLRLGLTAEATKSDAGEVEASMRALALEDHRVRQVELAPDGSS